VCCGFQWERFETPLSHFVQLLLPLLLSIMKLLTGAQYSSYISDLFHFIFSYNHYLSIFLHNDYPFVVVTPLFHLWKDVGKDLGKDLGKF
jgi:hypothetical protein